jgi:hypothetical protein
MRTMIVQVNHTLNADGTYVTDAQLQDGQTRQQKGRYEYKDGQLKLTPESGRGIAIAEVMTRGPDMLVLQMRGMYSAYSRKK